VSEREFDLKHALAVSSRVDALDAKIVALLHDAVEDGFCTIQDLYDADMQNDVVEAIATLTRGNESYPHYIDRIKHSGDDLAIAVKLADLDANLSRMDEEHSSLTGRYRHAIAELTGRAAA
jgi:(p)ppGpp synthase/HD superfamily hydrolase